MNQIINIVFSLCCIFIVDMRILFILSFLFGFKSIFVKNPLNYKI
jgi:hypothetical protein